MSSFDDLSFAVDNFCGEVRLLPLPNLVLFPQVMQPLHIFEPRYRVMLEDALAGDRLITSALLAPGWERNYEQRPTIYPVACLGRITTFCRLADGTYNILLLGLRRVRLLGEMKTKRAFRKAKAEICPDVYPIHQSARHEILQHQLREAFLQVIPLLPEALEQLDQLIDADVSLGMLSDIISYMLNINLQKKQSLLAEIDVYRRTELLLDYLWEIVDEIHSDSSVVPVYPPHFSAN